MTPMLQPLFISVDPARDTLRQLRHYKQDFHPDMVFLTGTRDQVEVATRSYRVYFSKVPLLYLILIEFPKYSKNYSS